MAGDTWQILQRHLLEDASAKSEAPLSLYILHHGNVSSIKGLLLPLILTFSRCFINLFNSPSSGRRWDACSLKSFVGLTWGTLLYTMTQTHLDNAFSSIEGATTPKLKNAPPILSPLLFSLMLIYYHYSYIDHEFSSGTCVYTELILTQISFYTHRRFYIKYSYAEMFFTQKNICTKASFQAHTLLQRGFLHGYFYGEMLLHTGAFTLWRI